MIDFKRWDQHSRQTKCAEEADQLEWRTFHSGSSPVDASQLDDEVSGAIEEVQTGGENVDAFGEAMGGTVIESVQGNLRTSAAERLRSEKKSEELNAGTLAEIERRISVLGVHYPFELRASSLHFQETDLHSHTIYLDCLRTSVNPSNRDREDFEALVVEALRAYLGGAAEAQLFGWQTWTASSRPRRIKAMVEELHSRTGEWPWNPEADLPDDPAPNLIKDMGMDAVAWLPMPDKRWGRLMLLAQCATGRGDWEEKLGDVNWNEIEDWIRPMPHRWTIRCFAVPFHLPNDAKWRKASKVGGLFFDRARLTLMQRGYQSIALRPQRTAEGGPHSQSPGNAPLPS